jgi:hypothetical protein
MSKGKKRVQKSSSRRNNLRKSLKRKSLKRKTLKRKNLKRKTLKRKNTRRKTLKRKTLKRRSQRGGVTDADRRRRQTAQASSQATARQPHAIFGTEGLTLAPEEGDAERRRRQVAQASPHASPHAAAQPSDTGGMPTARIPGASPAPARRSIRQQDAQATTSSPKTSPSPPAAAPPSDYNPGTAYISPSGGLSNI